MADNQFVPENQLLVNEMNLEKNDLGNQSERSLYSNSEPPTHFFQQKDTGNGLFDANESATKDFSLDEIVVKSVDSYKDAGNDLTVPNVGDGISRETEQENLNESQYLKSLSKSLLKLESEEKPCHGEILKQNVVHEMQNVLTKGAELIAEEKSTKTDVTKAATTVRDSEPGRGMHKGTRASYLNFPGSFQLSPFGVKAIQSSEATIAGREETINFATLAGWSNVLHQEGRKVKDDNNLDNIQTVMIHQRQIRSILKKEEVDNVTKPETKSVHFGFPVVWTKYFSSDDDVESTASTELLFSDEEFEDEVCETEDQEVPRNENLDEPCTKKARTDDGSFIPSFAFPEVISIPSLDKLRFTDEEKDHNMTEVTNGTTEAISIEAIEKEKKVEKFQNSSPQEEYSTVKNNQKELVPANSNEGPGNVKPAAVPCHELVLANSDDGPGYVKPAAVPCHELVLANSDDGPGYVKPAAVPCRELVLANSDDGPGYVKPAAVPCHELVLANSDDGPGYVKPAAVPCHELVLANSDDGPDYVTSAEVPCHEMVLANSGGGPDYIKPAAVPCHELVLANSDDGPDYVTSAEVPCHEMVLANSGGGPDYIKPAKVPCHELVLANSDEGPGYVKSAEVPCHEMVLAHSDDGPDYVKPAEVPCHEMVLANSGGGPDYIKPAEVPCHELVLANSDDGPGYVKSAEVPCHELVLANSDDGQGYVKPAEVPCHELVLANSEDGPGYVKPAEVPCHEMVLAHSDDGPDYVTSAKVPCYELVLANSEDGPDYVTSAKVPYLDKVPDASDLYQQTFTDMQESPQLPKKHVLTSQRNDDSVYGMSDIVPYNDILPDANDQYRHIDIEKAQFSEKLIPANHDIDSNYREKFKGTTPEKCFSSEKVSQNLFSDRNSLTELQPIQGEDASSFTSEGAQEVPETVDNITCNRVNDPRPAGVCPSLFRLGEEYLLDDVGSELFTSLNSLGKPWMDNHFLEFEDPSLYQDDRGIITDGTSKIPMYDDGVTQKLETPSLSPVRNPWAKTSSFEEEFYTCDNDNDSCSSQISEMAEEVKNLLTMGSSRYEQSRPQSPDRSTVSSIENQDLGTVPDQTKYSTQFLSALERDACSLDGPELLEMAMHLVESAIAKTAKCPNKRLEQCPRSSAESNKTSRTEVKVTPAFTWKKFSYESQRATLNLDNQDKNGSDQGMENGSLNHRKLYYNKSCTRPLRVGLSRRSRTHSLHPYAARPRSSNATENKFHQLPDYNSTE